MDRVNITKRGVDRLRAGHPWIYRSDLLGNPGDSIESGAAVEVADDKGRPQGTAFYSVQSQIALRMIARETVEPDRAFFRSKLASAIALRERLFPGATALRLVHGEADLLPGLVVDRYGDHLSIQTPIPATERRKELIADLLEELLKPAGIVERNDARSRLLEGLDQTKGILRGSYEGPTEYREGDTILSVDLLEGQKTGAFLDQRENHIKAGDYAKGRALDLFSYAGGFALQLARGAKSVRAVEISEAACETIGRNAERTGRDVDVVCANVFDWLRDELSSGARYDTIVLDPPAFAKSKSAIPAATRGYKEVNLRALQLLAPGGVLLTFTCSYHVGPEDFEAIVTDAARDAKREVQVLERLGAGRDHPVLLTAPETRYLKGLVLRAP
ncbi:class I SAM-dependent rRNA methyltransferase [Vulgatibacter incomptus]|uniref:LSU m5C1962 methyltransferase RlmI n=1 Tax=Vulgatibacter incomptus TaxID=1391653 RepID=A0A0K1PEK1_9BACT|nr:class I SAM-dependent rRNA methyltransferase [Vulgatibacter incomptus]AKU91841.1 LSU m5C1962 methyltransferase RlmI [Vulgatibacter incomptus]